MPDSPFAFVDAALDRADALRDDPEALARLWPEAHVVLLDDDGRALAEPSPQGTDAVPGLLAPTGVVIGGGPGAAVFLGLREGRAWFAQRAATVALDAPQRMDLRSAARLWPAFEATVFAQARAVLHWHAKHRYCGACGGELDFVRAGWLGRCRTCGEEHYPRTDQAIIAAVTDGTRLLLGRQAVWPHARWSVLAGFVEPGESLEQTVAREVLEETGVRVRDTRYLASQPWPFPGSLMLGFLVRAEPDTPVVGEELQDARWFDADAVRAGLANDWDSAPSDDATAASSSAVGPDAHVERIVLSSPISIARWLVEHWLQTQSQ